MRSKYFIFSTEKESWYIKDYYKDLLEQPSEYKVVRNEGWGPSVWHIAPSEKYPISTFTLISLHTYKKGDVIGIL